MQCFSSGSNKAASIVQCTSEVPLLDQLLIFTHASFVTSSYYGYTHKIGHETIGLPMNNQCCCAMYISKPIPKTTHLFSFVKETFEIEGGTGGLHAINIPCLPKWPCPNQKKEEIILF